MGERPAVTAGPYVVLEVRDTGTGIGPQVLPRLFEPFFTTKPTGVGTGLGLSTVFGIVTQSGGHIRVQSVVDQGTAFTIYLPRLTHEPMVTGDVRAAPMPCGSETILMVEDEAAVRDIARRILTRQGYSVIEAGTGSEALFVSVEHPGPVYFMLSDVVMPGMSGDELAARLATIRPATRVLFMSGYADADLVRRGGIARGVAFVQKPFSPIQLVRQTLDQPAEEASVGRAG